MGHPNGGQGTWQARANTFQHAYDSIGIGGIVFESSRGERITARHGIAGDRVTPIITFIDSQDRRTTVCHACWEFSHSCTGTRSRRLTVPYDAILPV